MSEKIKLSKYQEAIIDFFKKHPQENMYVEALAGTAKSFTACKMLETVENNSLYVAFNKSVQQEFANRISNPKVKIYTMHGLCNMVLTWNLENNGKLKTSNDSKGFGKQRDNTNNVGKQGVLDNLKIYNILEKKLNASKTIKYNFEYKMFLKENYTRLYGLVRLKFVDLTSEYAKYEIVKIVNDYSLFRHEEFGKPAESNILSIIKSIDAASLEQFEQEGIYDFDDMLYITLIKLKNREWQVPPWNLYYNIVADEAQDFSNVQTLLLKYFKRKQGRFIFILDSNQAIYSFAGANCNSYLLIKTLYAPLQTFKLPINYRCPSSHLDLVNKLYNIGIQSAPNAIEGEIFKISKMKAVDLLSEGDYLIGRKNKWLTPMILELVKKGKKVFIKDADFVSRILKFIDKSKVASVNDLIYKIEGLQEKLQIQKEKQKEEEAIETFSQNLDDLYDTLNNLIVGYKQNCTSFSIKEFRKYVENLLNTVNSDDCITISSIHSVKGLESDNVFVLNEGKPTMAGVTNSDQYTQEKNLSYIALTRAKKKLYLVKAEGPEYE